MSFEVPRAAAVSLALTGAALTACSTPPVEVELPPQTTETPLEVCGDFPDILEVGHQGDLPILAFHGDPGCEVPLWRTPRDDHRVGAITVRSHFVIDCIANVPPPSLIGRVTVTESGTFDAPSGYALLAFDVIDPKIKKYTDGLPECPPINLDV